MNQADKQVKLAEMQLEHTKKQRTFRAAITKLQSDQQLEITKRDAEFREDTEALIAELEESTVQHQLGNLADQGTAGRQFGEATGLIAL